MPLRKGKNLAKELTATLKQRDKLVALTEEFPNNTEWKRQLQYINKEWHRIQDEMNAQ